MLDNRKRHGRNLLSPAATVPIHDLESVLMKQLRMQDGRYVCAFRTRKF